MEWSVDASSDVPPSRQLVVYVLDALAAEELAAGDQLPSIRQLAARALVNHNTAARAYRDLEQLGVVRPQNGLGVFVTDRGPDIATHMRRDRTLSEFTSAAQQALRAGHETHSLSTLLKSISEEAAP